MKSAPVIWMTVPRRYDRRHFFEKHNVQAFSDIHWIKYNGADPIWHSFDSTGNAETHGHAACWLTHYGAWQVGLAVCGATGKPGAAFLEDDVIVVPDFPEHLKSLEDGAFGDSPVHFDAFASIGGYGYWLPISVMRLFVEKMTVRKTHVDKQMLAMVPFKNYPKTLVTEHGQSILSETCEYTWNQIHKKPITK